MPAPICGTGSTGGFAGAAGATGAGAVVTKGKSVPAGALAVGVPARIIKKKVLLVEDDPNLGMLLQEYLKHKNFEVEL